MPEKRRKSVVNWREMGDSKFIGTSPVIWVPIVCVLLGSCLAWAGWNTNSTINSVKTETFEEHKSEYREHLKDASKQYLEIVRIIREQGERIEDKLDIIDQRMYKLNDEMHGQHRNEVEENEEKDK